MDLLDVDISDSQSHRKDLVKSSLKKIDDVYSEAEQGQVGPYYDSFEEGATLDMIMLAEVKTEDLKKEHERIIDDFEKKRLEEERSDKERMKELEILQEESKAELIHRGGVLRKAIVRNELESIEKKKKKKKKKNPRVCSLGS
eukprot:TRINITY_DN6092_c0_g1_i3.p3 TRINITY_DN6092_c0_g1~~TRINITY_DN6092_c0_g1_i3.p3  ORF type:complete len:143 (+),score=44.07 TRINITY_DN6092_c0_g1_i3:161-589(+)